jgi:hypothetical protein
VDEPLREAMDDPLREARGIVNGVGLSLILWAAVWPVTVVLAAIVASRCG